MPLKAQRPSKQQAKLLSQVSKLQEPPKRLNALIEPELYRAIKIQAVRENTSVSEITRRLWVTYLSELERRG